MKTSPRRGCSHLGICHPYSNLEDRQTRLTVTYRHYGVPRTWVDCLNENP
jgi:hypothetical protein